MIISKLKNFISYSLNLSFSALFASFISRNARIAPSATRENPGFIPYV